MAETLDPALQRIAACVRNLTDAGGAALALGGEDGMVCVARSGPAAPPIGAAFDGAEGLSGECIRTGESVVCVNAAADPRVNYQACRALGVASMVYLPLRSAEGKTIGMLAAFSSEPLHFSQRDVASLRFTEALVREALERSGTDVNSVSLTSLLRQIEPLAKEETAEPGWTSQTRPPAAVASPGTMPTTLAPPALETPVSIAAEATPAPPPTCVGRVVDESAQESEAESGEQSDPDSPEGHSVIPAMLALLLVLLVSVAAWNHNRFFRLRQSPAKPAAAGKIAQTPPTVPVAVVNDAPGERVLTPNVSLHTGESNEQVTILLPRPIRYEGYQLDHPDRIYFDLHDIRLTDDKGREFTAAEGIISGVRLALYEAGTTRIVFDLRRPASFEAMLAQNPPRLMVQLHTIAQVQDHASPGSANQGMHGSTNTP